MSHLLALQTGLLCEGMLLLLYQLTGRWGFFLRALYTHIHTHTHTHTYTSLRSTHIHTPTSLTPVHTHTKYAGRPKQVHIHTHQHQSLSHAHTHSNTHTHTQQPHDKGQADMFNPFPAPTFSMAVIPSYCPVDKGMMNYICVPFLNSRA